MSDPLDETSHEISATGSVKEIIIQLRYQRHLNLLLGITIHVIFFTVVVLRGIIIRTRLRRILTPSRLIPRFKPKSYPRHHIHAYTISKRYGITIPTFSQFCALACFFLLLTLFAVSGYGWRDPSSPDYVPDTIYVIRYIATRTGVLSFVLLPLLILTAGRMNLLVAITEWSFDSWNIFHRFVGRMSLLFAIIHTIAYLIYAFMIGRMARNFTKLYWNCGFVALALFLILSTLPSIRFIRRLSYEVFLAGHIASTLLGLFVLFYHTLWRFAQEWLYLTLLCWAIERLARVFKTTSLLPITGALTDHGTVMRLDLYLTDALAIRPGHFAHLRFPEVRAIESHPFSIAASFDLRDQKREKMSSPPPDAEDDEAERTPLMMMHTDAAAVQHVAFLIRPYDGMTRSLYELFAGAPPTVDGSIPIKLYFEGPYGHEHRLSTYTAVVFIAGGVGLSFTLPYLLHWDTSRDTQHEDALRVDGAVSVDERLQAAVEIYYTGARDAEWDGPVEWRDRVFFGRPGMEDMMTEALIADEETAGSSKARLGVFACGPGGMLDQCRSDVEMLRRILQLASTIEEASTA
ncbi:hypothetical protein BDZ89DRAFT_1046412 [Hymenopellis radicata]|nr:hypothetical protein BDZ89DRAFT_1046412 [Hymenopellis radicata]